MMINDYGHTRRGIHISTDTHSVDQEYIKRIRACTWSDLHVRDRATHPLIRASWDTKEVGRVLWVEHLVLGAVSDILGNIIEDEDPHAAQRCKKVTSMHEAKRVIKGIHGHHHSTVTSFFYTAVFDTDESITQLKYTLRCIVGAVSATTPLYGDRYLQEAVNIALRAYQAER